MSFPYPINITIPATGNYPGNDQPGMQTNYANINGFLGVDHVPPGTNPGAGQHNQVTFPNTNVPSLPATPPVLFVQNPTGGPSYPQLFWYSGNAAQSASQYTVATNGSTMVLGGIIMKWGVFFGQANGSTISFVSPFPNNCFNVTLTIGSITSANQIGISGSPSVSGFTLAVSPSANLAGGYYLAIGN